MNFRHYWRPLCSVLGRFWSYNYYQLCLLILGSDVFDTEVLLVPVLNDSLRFEILSRRVFGCLGDVLIWGIRGVVVTDSAGSDSTESWSKVPSGSLSSCKSIGGSVIWADNAVNYDFVGSQHSASRFRLVLSITLVDNRVHAWRSDRQSNVLGRFH